jgi:hypothetical protein
MAVSAVHAPVAVSNGHHYVNNNSYAMRPSSSHQGGFAPTNGTLANTSAGGGGLRQSQSNSNSLAAALVNRPSLIEYKNLRFLIMDAPTESNLHAYIEVQECSVLTLTILL